MPFLLALAGKESYPEGFSPLWKDEYLPSFKDEPETYKISSGPSYTLLQMFFDPQAANSIFDLPNEIEAPVTMKSH